MFFLLIHQQDYTLHRYNFWEGKLNSWSGCGPLHAWKVDVHLGDMDGYFLSSWCPLHLATGGGSTWQRSMSRVGSALMMRSSSILSQMSSPDQTVSTVQCTVWQSPGLYQGGWSGQPDRKRSSQCHYCGGKWICTEFTVVGHWVFCANLESQSF